VRARRRRDEEIHSFIHAFVRDDDDDDDDDDDGTKDDANDATREIATVFARGASRRRGCATRDGAGTATTRADAIRRARRRRRRRRRRARRTSSEEAAR
jgi:hypothetical protein